MALGKPALNVPRVKPDGTIDGRAVAQFMANVAERLVAIEKALQLSPTQTLQDQLQNLTNQPDGVVVKAAGVLRTRRIAQGAGVTVLNQDGAKGDPTISAP